MAKCGTRYKYQKYKCRCAECREANAVFCRKQRNKNPESNKRFNDSSKKYIKKCREYVRSQKEQPCVDCGMEYPFYVMHYDHIDPKTKRASVSSLVGIPTIDREIAKCELVCANCHAERTYQQRKNGVI